MDSRTKKGKTSELEVARRLTEMGYVVSEPIVDARYDFVVDINDSMWRVQVKTARLRHDTESVTAELRNNKRTNDGSTEAKIYGEDEIDIIAVYNPVADEVYWFEFEEVGERCVSISMKDKDSVRKCNRNHNFAEDYVIERRLS